MSLPDIQIKLGVALEVLGEVTAANDYETAKLQICKCKIQEALDDLATLGSELLGSLDRAQATLEILKALR